MMRLLRNRWAWGTVAGMVVLVLLSVRGVIPVDVAGAITLGGTMLVALVLVFLLPMVMVVLLTRILRRRRYSTVRKPHQVDQTEIAEGPLSRLTADWMWHWPGKI